MRKGLLFFTILITSFLSFPVYAKDTADNKSAPSTPIPKKDRSNGTGPHGIDRPWRTHI